MKVQYFDPKQLPDHSVEFRKSFDGFLNLCEFNEEEKLGILFFLGAFLPGEIFYKESLSDEYNQQLKVLSLYSKSTGYFSDYGDLYEDFFSKWIYNANLVISKISGDENLIENNLLKLPKSNIIVGKANPINGFIDLFEENSFNLNSIQNLNDLLFRNVGIYLKEKKYSHSRAYDVGFAYRLMMMEKDSKGSHYLFSRINSSLSPLYQALFYSPILFVFNHVAFKSNHLFSQILNMFYGGEESNLFPIAQSIHQFHQFIFYKEGSIELKDFWKFTTNSDEGSAIIVFHNAIKIYKTGLKQNANFLKQSNEVFDKNLIDAKININDFLHSILVVIQSKYSNGVLFKEFIDGWDAKWNNGWNNKGEYIQFLVILFYETCLHALIVDEIYDLDKY